MAILDLIVDHVVPLAGAAAIFFVLRTVWLFARLRRFGGSVLVGVSEWPHSRALLSGNGHEWYAQANEMYGPIARIGPNLLITNSPEVWMHVNKEPEYKRSNWWYHALRIEHRRDNVFSETDNVKHDKRRLQMMPGVKTPRVIA